MDDFFLDLSKNQNLLCRKKRDQTRHKKKAKSP